MKEIYNIQKSLDFIYNDDNLKNINFERIALSRHIKILKRSNIQIIDLNNRINKLEKIINFYDENLLNSLKILSTCKNNDNLIFYEDNSFIKIDILNENSCFLYKFIFKIKKFFINNHSLLKIIYESANNISKENAEIKEKVIESIDNLKNTRNSKSNFYYSIESIKKHADLTTEINQILDINSSKDEKIIQEREINRGKASLEDMTYSFRLQNLCGMTITSTLETSNENNFIDQPGSAIYSSEKEFSYLKEMLQENSNETSYSLSTEEKEKMKQYVDDLERSRDLNFMLAGLRNEDKPEELRLAAKMEFEKITHLKEEQSIFMDVGYSGHAMRAQFLKHDNKIEINLFDTSGGLELWISKNPFLSAIHYFQGKKEYICLSTSVTLNEFEKRGRAYLEQVIGMESRPIVEQLDDKSNYFRYMDFIRVFRSINPHKTLQTRHSAQKSQNCFAQRIRAAEVHYLGIATYTKARIFSLMKGYDELLAMAKDELNSTEFTELKIKLQNKRELKPDELANVREKLNLLEDYPQDVSSWYYILALVNHNISKPRRGKIKH